LGTIRGIKTKLRLSSLGIATTHAERQVIYKEIKKRFHVYNTDMVIDSLGDEEVRGMVTEAKKRLKEKKMKKLKFKRN